MEKKLYECQFYLMDEKGNRTTDYLTTYIETDNPYYVSKLLIAIYAKGNSERIFYATPQLVRDPDKLLKEILYFYYQFRFRDSKGNIRTYEYNDVIMARDWRKAEQIFLAKYAGGDSKKVWHPSSHTYRYDELYKIPSKLETYEFEFYLKDDRGNKASNMMKLSIDEVSYYKAELKLIEILAEGDRNKVWHSTGQTIGLALPSLLKERREKEEREKQNDWDRKNAERIKTVVTMAYNRKNQPSKTINNPDTEKKGINKKEETDDNLSANQGNKDKKHPIQEIIIFALYLLCGVFIVSLLELSNNDILNISISLAYALLMVYSRWKLRLSRWTLAFFNIAAIILMAVFTS